MRNPDRIDSVLAAIKHAWVLQPDLRLGQLIVNMAGGDPFYTEDDELLKRLYSWTGCLHPGIYRGQMCPTCKQIT